VREYLRAVVWQVGRDGERSDADNLQSKVGGSLELEIAAAIRRIKENCEITEMGKKMSKTRWLSRARRTVGGAWFDKEHAIYLAPHNTRLRWV